MRNAIAGGVCWAGARIGKWRARIQGKAKEDAARSAVQKAIGSYVSSDVLIKNDEVIKDEVLSLSAGYIDTMEVIEEGKRADGLYYVKVKALVVSEKLMRQLKQLNITVQRLDSTSIFAEATTKLDTQKSSEEAWTKLFKSYPGNAYDLKVLGKPFIIPLQNTNNIIAVFSVEAKWSDGFISELKQVYKNTVNNRYVINRGDNMKQPAYSQICIATAAPLQNTTYPPGNISHREYISRPPNPQNIINKDSRLFFGLPINNYDTYREKRDCGELQFKIPKAIASKLMMTGGYPPNTSGTHIRMKLMDSNGKTINASTGIINNGANDSDLYNSVSDFNNLKSIIFRIYTSTIRYISFTINKDDLSLITKTELTVVGPGAEFID